MPAAMNTGHQGGAPDELGARLGHVVVGPGGVPWAGTFPTMASALTGPTGSGMAASLWPCGHLRGRARQACGNDADSQAPIAGWGLLHDQVTCDRAAVPYVCSRSLHTLCNRPLQARERAYRFSHDPWPTQP
jgi:hypothetical protein